MSSSVFSVLVSVALDFSPPGSLSILLVMTKLMVLLSWKFQTWRQEDESKKSRRFFLTDFLKKKKTLLHLIISFVCLSPFFIVRGISDGEDDLKGGNMTKFRNHNSNESLVQSSCVQRRTSSLK
jgi:hypothetical protein